MLYRSLIVLLLVSGFSDAKTCKPVADKVQAQYLIGYGSLMNDVSKRRTDPAAAASMPVLVTGFKRTWLVRSEDRKITYLGVTQAKDAQFNGVLYRVSGLAAIAAYDQREQGYCRLLVPKTQVKSLTQQPLPPGQYWIYSLHCNQSFSAPVTAEYPIAQTYVDTFISGCMKIAKRFALPDYTTQCLTTTHGWTPHWRYDRAKPVTGHAPLFSYEKIDKLLKQNNIPR